MKIQEVLDRARPVINEANLAQVIYSVFHAVRSGEMTYRTIFTVPHTVSGTRVEFRFEAPWDCRIVDVSVFGVPQSVPTRFLGIDAPAGFRVGVIYDAATNQIQ